MELIDRDEAIRAIIKFFEEAPTVEDLSAYSDKLWKQAYESGKAEAVRTGHWKTWNEYRGKEFTVKVNFRCSECKAWFVADEDEEIFRYCPNCGSKNGGTE